MLAITRTLAQDHASDGVRVNAVNPTLIHTPLRERASFVNGVCRNVDGGFAKFLT